MTTRLKKIRIFVAVVAVCMMCDSCGNSGNEQMREESAMEEERKQQEEYSSKVEEQEIIATGTCNGHDWVDLGLPSGTKWATCNVGSDTPEGYGDYFAWGETAPKATYTPGTYRYCNINGEHLTITKYCDKSSWGYNGFTDNFHGCVDNLTTLESSDDAATANWGSGWRIPTYDEMNELRSNCTVTWTTQNGVNGCLFIGPNGNSIFLPAAGYRSDRELNSASSYGGYLSSTLGTGKTAITSSLISNTACGSPDYAWDLSFGSDNYDMDYSYRGFGRSVRPVCSGKSSSVVEENLEDDFKKTLGDDVKIIAEVSNSKMNKIYYLEDGIGKLMVYDYETKTTKLIQESVHSWLDWKLAGDKLFYIVYNGGNGSAVKDISYININDESSHYIFTCYEAKFENNCLKIKELIATDTRGPSCDWKYDSKEYSLDLFANDSEIERLKKINEQKWM